MASKLQSPTFVGPLPTPFTGETLRSPTTRTRRAQLSPQCNSKQPEPAPRRLRPKRKASAFENTLDDLTMKRMGRGTIYYGERASSTAGAEETEADEDDMLLKPDPVLVAGATGRTGQWIALGLVNQAFNVRVLSRSFDAAEKLFGPSGSNMDIFQADLTTPAELVPAVEGAVAIVVASGAPWWWPGGYDAVDVAGVANLLEACKQAPSVKRFVLISAIDGSSARGRAKHAAEDLVRASGLPYVIVRAASLSEEEGGMRKIMLEPGERAGAGGGLSRVDLAQAVCQALVYDRAIQQLKEADPDSEFDFPSCMVSVQNSEEPYRPDKRFWKRVYNKVSDAYREKTDIEDAAVE